jgi:hypothetical protein
VFEKKCLQQLLFWCELPDNSERIILKQNLKGRKVLRIALKRDIFLIAGTRAF